MRSSLQVVLGPLIAIALKISNIHERTGRRGPNVITWATRETTCRHTHASTCSHREKYLFSCAFLFSFVSVASFPFFFPFVSKWRLNCGCFISLKKENECCTLFSELFIDHCYLSALENFKYSASKPGRLFNYNYCKQQKHECADRLLMFVPCFYPDASTKGASRVFFFLIHLCLFLCNSAVTPHIACTCSLIYVTVFFHFQPFHAEVIQLLSKCKNKTGITSQPIYQWTEFQLVFVHILTPVYPRNVK